MIAAAHDMVGVASGLMAASVAMSTVAGVAAYAEEAGVLKPHQKTEQQLAALFDCVVQKDTANSAAFVVGSATTKEWQATHKKFTKDLHACMNADRVDFFNGSTNLVRGGVARALLLQGVPAPRPADSAILADPTEYTSPEQRAEVGKRLSSFAQCVLEKAPVQAGRFVRTVRYDAEELAVFREMKPLIEPCIVPVNDIGIDSRRLRALLAIELWGRTSQSTSMPVGRVGQV